MSSYESYLTRVTATSGRYQYLRCLLLSILAFAAGFEIANLVLAIQPPQKPDCGTNSTNSTNSTADEKDSSGDGGMRMSLVTEFNLACGGRGVYIHYIFMLFFGGQLVGMVMNGMADRFGRRPTLLALVLAETLINMAMALAPTLALQLILRFLRGCAIGTFILGHTLLLEIISIQQRPFLASFYWLAWQVGMVSAAGLNYLTQDWRWTKGLGQAYSLIYLAFIFFIPESPRWLLVRGRDGEAKRELKKMGVTNGIFVAEVDHILANLKVDDPTTNDQPGTFWDLFRRKTMCRRTVSMSLLIFSLCISYYATFVNLKFFHQDIFMSVLIQGLVEMCAAPLSYALIALMGLKALDLILLILAAATLSPVAYLHHAGNTYLGNWLGILGKMFLVLAFSVSDVLQASVYPTELRSKGVMVSTTFGNSANLFSTLVFNLHVFYYFLPTVVVVAFLILSIILLILFIPDMTKRSLPQKLKDID